MKKNKFVTAILSEDEWKAIKIAMSFYEYSLNKSCEFFVFNKDLNYLYEVVKHFNEIGVDNIENLMKEERRSNGNKSKESKH